MDALTGQMVNLYQQPTYTFAVANAAALLTGYFRASALTSAPGLLAAQVSVFPNPTHGTFAVQLPGVAGATAVRAELLNALGQVVRHSTAALPAAGTTLP